MKFYNVLVYCMLGMIFMVVANANTMNSEQDDMPSMSPSLIEVATVDAMPTTDANEAALMEVEAEADLEAEVDAEADAEADADAEYYVVRRGANGQAIAYEVPNPPPRYAVVSPSMDYVMGVNELPPASHVLTARALSGHDAAKLSTNPQVIRSAGRTAVEAKGELDYLHDKIQLDAIKHRIALVEREADDQVRSFMEAEAKNYDFSFLESGVEAEADAEADAEMDAEMETELETEMETEAEAGALMEVEAEDLPPVNPHMIPIPEAVRDLVNQAEENPYNFPATPVYIVEKPGQAFVPEGQTFEARVGPGGAQLADFILTRAGNVKKNSISSHVFQSAMDLTTNATDTLAMYRTTINLPLPDTPASGEVEAAVKPTIVP